jgi:DNA-binding transcriptional ArsR family regulator
MFSALSDPARRTIGRRLSQGETSVSDLAELVDISLPAVSRHLRILHEAGLIDRVKRGRVTWCRLRPEALLDARSWLDDTRRHWDQRLDRLQAMLEER